MSGMRSAGRWLFAGGILLAAGLVLAVVLAPLADDGEATPRVVALLARDGAVRRTCLASAAGLVVTACVFFRPTSRGRPTTPRAVVAGQRRRPPPMAGA